MKIGDEIYVHGYVDEIRKNCVIVKNKGGYFGTVQEEISEAIPPIDLREMDLWIPVSERLPENKSPVMVTCDGLVFDSRVVTLALYDDKTFFNFDGQKIGKVYAWQPLPKPYEVEDDEKKEK